MNININNIKKLQLGEIKYKELISILEMDNKRSGNPRISQIRELNRYILIDHIKASRYEIKEIYKEIKDKIDNRKNGNNNIYGKYLEKLVLDLLVQSYKADSTNKKVYLSRDKMLMALNMVNKNYTYGKFNKDKLSDYLKVDIENMKEFYTLNNTNLISTIERTFKRLASKSLIDWQLVTTVVTNEQSVLKDGFISNRSHRQATEEERSLIIGAELMVLEEMGYENKQKLFLSGEYQIFISKVKDILSKEQSRIISYYKSYDIVFNQAVIRAKKRMDKFLLEHTEREQVKEDLNKTVVDNTKKLTERRYNEVKDKVSYIGDYNEIKNYKYKNKVRRSQNEYVEDTEKIIDAVINSSTEDISHNINSNKKQIETENDEENLPF